MTHSHRKSSSFISPTTPPPPPLSRSNDPIGSPLHKRGQERGLNRAGQPVRVFFWEHKGGAQQTSPRYSCFKLLLQHNKTNSFLWFRISLLCFFLLSSSPPPSCFSFLDFPSSSSSSSSSSSPSFLPFFSLLVVKKIRGVGPVQPLILSSRCSRACPPPCCRRTSTPCPCSRPTPGW
jgi:hypothetical protein